MGLLVYHSEKEQRKKGVKTVDKSPMYSSPTLQRTHVMKQQRGRIIYRNSPIFGRSPRKSKLRSGNVGSYLYGTMNKATGSSTTKPLIVAKDLPA